MIFVHLDPCRAEPVGDPAVFQWTPRLRLAARASFSIYPLFWCTAQGNMMMDGEITRWMRLDFTHLWILFTGIDPSEEEFNRVGRIKRPCPSKCYFLGPAAAAAAAAIPVMEKTTQPSLHISPLRTASAF
ncbi:hypothetical protein H0E87_009561 [Populus deltoides]|uniref:Uncharacterized protein n=1 Tax=Populus deltoides TaxID=3696 RepID=A0A8T2YQ65_POPDE|nr:hypothetical protein H0E87_009561 [Populus deltoides]